MGWKLSPDIGRNEWVLVGAMERLIGHHRGTWDVSGWHNDRRGKIHTYKYTCVLFAMLHCGAYMYIHGHTYKHVHCKSHIPLSGPTTDNCVHEVMHATRDVIVSLPSRIVFTHETTSYSVAILWLGW